MKEVELNKIKRIHQHQIRQKNWYDGFKKNTLLRGTSFAFCSG
jgi:hypothetical protein